MSIVQRFVTRPLGAATVTAALMAIALVVVPISFEQTVGQEARLRFSGHPDPAVVQQAAQALAASLGGASVRMTMGETVELEARARGRSKTDATRIVDAFVKELAAKGVTATASITPWTEHRTSNLYAYAATQLRDITVQIQGRTDAEIEKDVRDQLAGMGVENPEVTFKRDGNTAELQISGKQDSGQLRAHIVRKIEGGAEPEARWRCR